MQLHEWPTLEAYTQGLPRPGVGGEGDSEPCAGLVGLQGGAAMLARGWAASYGGKRKFPSEIPLTVL